MIFKIKLNNSSAILQMKERKLCKIKINPTIRELIFQFIISSNGTLKNDILYKWKKLDLFVYLQMEKIDLNINSNKGKYLLYYWGSNLSWDQQVQ